VLHNAAPAAHAARKGRANVAPRRFLSRPRPRKRRWPTTSAAFMVNRRGSARTTVAERFKQANDDYSSIMVQGRSPIVSQRAFAERLHQPRAQGILGLCPGTRR